MLITSKTNPKIKELLKLHNNQKRKKSHLFFIEGSREINIAIKYEYTAVHFFICTELLNNSSILEGSKSICYEIPKEVYQHIAYREKSEGIIGVFEKKEINLINEVEKSPILVLDNIEKPGNLGAIYRTADALGIKNIVLTGSKNIDPYHPNGIRASLGALFSLNIQNIDYTVFLDYCNSKNIAIYSTSAKNAKNIGTFEPAERFALIMGSEEQGIDPIWEKHSKELLTIPMQGNVSSLNVSVATALCLYALTQNK